MKRFDDASRNVVRFSCTSVMLAGTIVVGTSAPAQAGQGNHGAGNPGSFRQFVLNNPGIGKGTLRQIYRQQYNNLGNSGGAGSPNPDMLQIPVISPLNEGNPRVNNEHLHQNLRANSFQLNANGRAVRMTSGVDLLLDSAVENITLGGKLFDQAGTITIDVGGTQKTLSAGQQVTAAEYIAAKQVLSTGSQSIVVDGSGRAVGGNVDLSAITGKGDRLRADDLTVPVNVTAFGDFAKGSTFQILGDLVNAGAVYATSTGRRDSGIIRADNITNQQGAVISSNWANRPEGAREVVDLTLQADHTLANFGEISSSGDLTLSAGVLISNAKVDANNFISARRNLNVNARTVENSGLMQAISGDVTFDTPYNTTLNVANWGGTINALNGAINIRDTKYKAGYDATIYGGDLFSQSVNVNAGEGLADINVEELTGTVNQKGNAAHVTANTQNLKLGNICLTGDPTYFNTGNISLDGDIKVGEDLVIIAGGNITNSESLTISTASKGAAAFPITLIAGANVSGATPTPNIGPIPPTVTGSAATITDVAGNTASAKGGSIIFSGVTIDSSALKGKVPLDGGDVLLAAYSGSDANSGKVLLTDGLIKTGGSLGGKNGSVTIIAGGAGQAITTGTIDTSGATGAGGSVNIFHLQPASTKGDINYDSKGKLLAGGSITTSPSAQNGSILVDGDIKSAGNVIFNGINTDVDLAAGVTITSKPGGGVTFNIQTGSTKGVTAGAGSLIVTDTLSVLTSKDGGTAALPLTTSAKLIFTNGTVNNLFIRDTNTQLVTLDARAIETMSVIATGTIFYDPGVNPEGAKNVTLISEKGNVGLSLFAPMVVQATDSLTVSAPSGSVYVDNQVVGLTKLAGTMSAKTTFNVHADGNLGADGAAVITAPTVNLTTDKLFVGLDGTLNGSSVVRLTSDLDIANGDITADINTKLLQLTSNGAAGIGTSGNRFAIDNGALAIEAIATQGDVWLAGAAGLKTFTVSGAASGIFDFTGQGTTVAGTISTSKNNLNVVTKGGNLTLAANATLSSGKDLSFQINDTTPAGAKFKLTLANGSTIQTKATGTDGKVQIGVGAPQANDGTPPTKGVSFAITPGNKIIWPEFGLKATGNNNVFAKGANVEFNNSLSSKNLVLGGNVAIIADPEGATFNVVPTEVVASSSGSLTIVSGSDVQVIADSTGGYVGGATGAGVNSAGVTAGGNVFAVDTGTGFDGTLTLTTGYSFVPSIPSSNNEIVSIFAHPGSNANSAINTGAVNVTSGDAGNVAINASANVVTAPTGNIAATGGHKNHVHNKTIQTTASGKNVATTAGVDIDLSSELANITLGGKLFDSVQSVTIEEGGTQKTLVTGSQVTAAEYLAAKQVLSEGGQRLVLDGSGKAVGGDIDFSAITGKGDRMRADDLYIPTNVSVYSNFAKGSTFQITGDLVNAGSLYALATGGRKGGEIHADNITNQAGAVITSNLTSSARTFNNARAELDFTLRADGDLTNYGEISSTGNLTLSAGGHITNGASSPSTFISAKGNLTVEATRIVNNGLMQSISGDVTFGTPTNEVLTVVNDGGTINALLGDINLRGDKYKAGFDATITGGDLFSQGFNINAGAGTATVDVKELTGTLNAKGLAAHVWAQTSELSLGKICMLGDPTFSNSAVNGDISLEGDITVGESLAIIASRNITNTKALTITANSATQGFPVTLIAGADITAGGSDTKLPPVGTGTLTTLSGKASASGGNIDFSSKGTVFINTRAQNLTGDSNGGDVLIAAYYSGTGTTSGFVKMTGGLISTGGRGKGTNGNVTLLAGGNAGTTTTNFSIITPIINAIGGASGGTITVQALQPMSSDAKPVTWDATGKIMSGNSIVADPAAIATNGRINVLSSMLARDIITVQSGGATTTDGGISFGNNLTISTQDPLGTINLTAADKTNKGNIFPSFSSTFFSTNTLNLTVGSGDVGIDGQLALGTNAQFINANGFNGKLGTSDILIFDTNPGITFAQGAASQFNLTTVGTTMSTTGGVIAGNFVLLGSTTASTGLSALNPVEVDANTLFAGNTKGGVVYIHNQNIGLTKLDGGSPFNATTLSIVTEGDMSILGLNTIQAANVTLETKGKFVSFDATSTINGTSTVNLISTGSIDKGTMSGAINTPLLTLTSAADIGSAANRFTPATGAKVVVANGANVFLQANAAVKTFNIGGGTATGTFDVIGAGKTTLISGNITSGKDLVISTPTGNLTVGAKGKEVSLLSGQNMTLAITNTVTPTKSKLTLASGASLATNATVGFGDITLSVGNSNPQVAGTPNPNVGYAELGGTIFWGTEGQTAKGSNIVIVAKGADVIFNNQISSKNIILNSNVSIVADPPVSSSAVLTSNLDEETLATHGMLSALSVPATGLVSGSTPSHSSSNILYSLPSVGDSFNNASPDAVSLSQLLPAQSVDLFGAVQSLNNTVTAQACITSAGSLNSFGSIDASSTTLLEDDSYIVSYGDSSQTTGSICGEQYMFDAVDGKRGIKQFGINHVSMDDEIVMPSGTMLVLASRPMNLSTPVGQLSIEQGAVVLVSRTEAGVSIYNLHDAKKESVSMQAAGRKLSVAPGNHMTITRHKTDFASLNAHESIGHRALSSSAINNELTMHTSEFSTLSAMACINPLKAVMSSTHPEAKKLAGKMMKTTAILMHIGGGRGDYQSYGKPRMTALVENRSAL